MRSSALILVVLAATVSATFIYNEDLAKEEAALSFAAYCPNSAINNWKLGYVSGNYPNIQNPQVFEDIIQGTKGYIAFNPTYNAITVVFRGSSNIQNWLDNIQFDKVDYNDACKCQVHKGFLEAFNSVKPQLDTLFAKYRNMYPNAVIHVTGHSLGAAMATLYATQLAIAGNSLQLTTFGLPRVGDKAYYDYFSSFTKVTHFRVVHEKDAVPHVPHKALDSTTLTEKSGTTELHTPYANWTKIPTAQTQFLFHQSLITAFTWDGVHQLIVDFNIRIQLIKISFYINFSFRTRIKDTLFQFVHGFE